MRSSETARALADAFAEVRDGVVLDVRLHDCPAEDAHVCADAIATTVGYVPCDWRELDRSAALGNVISCMQCDLAYQEPILSLEEARDLAQRFLSLFEEGARFFTNGDPFDASDRYRSRSWQPISAATFDAGVIAVSRDRVGIFWVEDED